MFYIIDITQEPSVRIEGLEFETYNEAIKWIEENGHILDYSIEKQQV